MMTTRKTPLALGVFLGSLCLCLAGYAEERSRPVARQAPPRQPAPAFQAHAHGPHPQGPTVRPHAVRTLAPRTVVHGRNTWAHWDHPEFARPAYYWDWNAIHSVMCVAEDSYGDQYPVTESAPPGFGLADMTNVEDDALDRCYSESGQDTTCVLASCTHI
jgi:hypothetical protein